MWLDIWGKQGGPNPQTPHSSAPARKPTLLAKQTQRDPCFPLSSWPQFPASLWNYSHNPITSSHGNQGAPRPPGTTKSASRSPCSFALFPSTTPVAPCGVRFLLPNLCVDVTDNLRPSHLSSVACPVPRRPHNPVEGIPPSPTGRSGGK